jgi:CubicO group peptidase (beta-lactamase class C family)
MRAWVLAGTLLAATGAHAADERAAVGAIFAPFSAGAQPGCAVGMFDKGAPLLVTGYGQANLETHAAIDGDTVFYAASMSKQFTALAVAKLVEEGRVSLDDDVRRWVPELRDYGRPITVAMLLHHTSGLRDWVVLAAISGREIGGVSRAEALDLIVRQQGLNFPTGTQFSYNNSGYFLLSEVVTRVSGKPFEAYVREAIFTPLHMTSSYLFPELPRPGASLALGYGPDGEGFKARRDQPGIAGSGGLMTTINDLQKFDRDFQVGHRVWTQARRDLLTVPGELNDGTKVEMPGEGLYYAGGLMVGQRAGQTWVTHDGASGGFRTDYVRLPQLGFGVAVLCNRSDSRAVTKAMAVIGAYRASSFDRADIGGHPATPPTTTSTPIAPDLAAAVDGDYASPELNTVYRLRRTDAGLTVTIQPNDRAEAKGDLLAPLTQIDPDTLTSSPKLGGSPTSFRLERDGKGAVTGFVLSVDRAKGIRFTRVQN